jgi:hypothetical protein
VTELDDREQQKREQWDRVLARKPKRCPACRSQQVAFVLWGMPEVSLRLLELEDQGEVEVAGCVLPAPPGAPAKWSCRSCHHAWGLTRAERRAGYVPVGPEDLSLFEIETG